MGSAVSSIGNAITGARNTINNATGTRAGDILAPVGASRIVPGAGAAYYAMGMDQPRLDQPEAPGVDPNLQRLKEAQQKNAQEFRQNLPGTKSRMAEDLSVQSNLATSAGNKQIQESNSRRGLLYGGLNQGQQLANTAKQKSKLGQAINTSNVNLENAANTLDAQAVETGMGIQQSQQAIQNQIYNNAMAQMNAQNQMVGGLIGAGTTIAMAGLL